MKYLQFIPRTIRSVRNAGLFVMGAFIVVLGVIWPSLFGSIGHGVYGAGIANADAPSGGDSGGGGSTGCATSCDACGCGDGGGCAGCGDGGGGDCCGGK